MGLVIYPFVYEVFLFYDKYKVNFKNYQVKKKYYFEFCKTLSKYSTNKSWSTDTEILDTFFKCSSVFLKVNLFKGTLEILNESNSSKVLLMMANGPVGISVYSSNNKPFSDRY